MNSKNKKIKISQIKNDPFTSKLNGRLLFGSFLTLAAACVLFAPEAIAVKEGEMKVGVTYLTGLLDNNIIPLVLLTGTGAGAAVSYMKSSFTPLVIAICTAGGYGFAHKWISSVYTVCI
jgi:hypothetical protein